MIKTKPEQFEIFHKILMDNAPKGFVPWYFPVCKHNKNPDGIAVSKRFKEGEEKEKASWKASHARLEYEEALQRLKKGYNVGIAARENDPLVLIDIDDYSEKESIPSTLTIMSRKRCGFHAFCFIKPGDKVLPVNIPTDKGEIRSLDQYVVAAGSYVKTDSETIESQDIPKEMKEEIKNSKDLGNYTVHLKQKPIEIGFEEIPTFFIDHYNKNQKEEPKEKTKATHNKKTTSKKPKNSLLFTMKMEDLVSTKLHIREGHPLHDSDTDANWGLSDDGAIGHCWRHSVSLNPIQFLAVKYGLLKCDEAGKGHMNSGAGDSLVTGNKALIKKIWQLAMEEGLLPPDDPEPYSKEKIENFTSFVEGEDFLAEQIYEQNEGTKFCVYYPATGKIEYKSFVMGKDNKLYEPIKDAEVFKGQIKLPSGIIEYKNDEELINDLQDFIRKWLDIKEDFLKYAVYNILKSWVYDIFHSLNYLRVMGEHGTGKSRFLDTLGFIHYKPIATTGAVGAAPIFRIIDKWKGTLIIDEADRKSSDEVDEVIKIVNVGYEKEKYVIRCDSENKEKVNFFSPYCPKILATRRLFDDAATESRCMTYVSTQTSRKDIPPNLTNQFWKDAEVIRNKLLLWRFKNYYEIDPDAGAKVDLGDIEPRLKQVNAGFVGLFAHNEKILSEFKQHLKEYQEGIIEDRQNTIEGQIVLAITLLHRQNENITAKAIINKADLTKRNGTSWSPRALSKYMKVLGFSAAVPKRDGESVLKVYEYEVDFIKSLAKRYLVRSTYEDFCNFVTNVTGVTKQAPPSENVENEGTFLDTDYNNKNNSFVALQRLQRLPGYTNGLTKLQILNTIGEELFTQARLSGDIFETKPGFWMVNI